MRDTPDTGSVQGGGPVAFNGAGAAHGTSVRESYGSLRDAGADHSEGPCLVAIVGDSGSGKSTVADAVTALLGPERVTTLRLDDYHRYTREERSARGMTALNPGVHNLTLMHEHLQLLRRGRPIRNRSYNHSDGSFGPIRAISPRDIVLVRGLLGFPTDELEALYHLSVFLEPEPELLFRWKLRRDVQTRGYTEAEVLKNIVQHLLDSKEFVLPQAARADIVVRYQLPTTDAADDQIGTSVTLRRRAAELVRANDLLEGLGPEALQHEDEGEVRIELGNDLTAEAVDRWASRAFPTTYRAAAIGSYTDDSGAAHTRPPLAGVEVLIARLIALLRCPGGTA